MRMPEEENARLKRLVADLTLDRHILQKVLRKEVCSRPAAVNWPGGSGSTSRSVCSRRVGWRCCGARLGIDAGMTGIRPRTNSPPAGGRRSGGGAAASMVLLYWRALHRAK